MEQLDNTATHKYLFECFNSGDFNKLLHLFEDQQFINDIYNNINDKTITIAINNIDKSGIFINVFKNENKYFHISFHLFPNDLRQSSTSEGLFHIKNNINNSIMRLRLNKKCNTTNKNKKTIIISIGRNPSKKASVHKQQKIITQKILDVINKYFNSELTQYFRKMKTTQNHKILSSITKHIKHNPHLNKLSPKSTGQVSYINQTTNMTKGGACPCNQLPKLPTPLSGGYRATKRNLKYLRKWKRGESIGFTMRSSLKAKGLIPRANGTKKVSPKYITFYEKVPKNTFF